LVKGSVLKLGVFEAVDILPDLVEVSVGVEGWMFVLELFFVHVDELFDLLGLSTKDFILIFDTIPIIKFWNVDAGIR
jgi:hypothetical protein